MPDGRNDSEIEGIAKLSTVLSSAMSSVGSMSTTSAAHGRRAGDGRPVCKVCGAGEVCGVELDGCVGDATGYSDDDENKRERLLAFTVPSRRFTVKGGTVAGMSAREKVLDAFQDLLLTEGERAATLDAVAARAAVSKGGLLYHFKSKDALVEGLLERLRALASEDAAAMGSDPRGPSIYYVDTSGNAASPFDSTLIAVSRLANDNNVTAHDTILAIQRGWFDMILAEVGDRAIARAIVLLGDGLYMNASMAGPIASHEIAGNRPEDRQELLDIVTLLKRHATDRGDESGPTRASL